MTYQLLPDITAMGFDPIPSPYIKNPEGSFILIEGEHAEAIRYREWLAEGNTPLPADPVD